MSRLPNSEGSAFYRDFKKLVMSLIGRYLDKPKKYSFVWQNTAFEI